MAGVEEVRAGIALAKDKASAGIAALQQAKMALEEAQQTLQQATSGSSQSEVTQSLGLFAEAMNQIDGIASTIEAANSSAESYSARL
ncbi:hypothetical protein SAMN05421504_102519 [Amycolatopsis xylanica]|uniref:Methyl-accepting chemotaxis protein n=1 Tax=Amycolatopsis xylanica TaxID=589385 RepID=A0A1H2ZGY3_9PSEU|nr:hypothetical protein [Amycolatopsis xylanica]SDX16625.1 hypothetical protein SAMN05421504_102519 [Amycolatopsis xylanica]